MRGADRSGFAIEALLSGNCVGRLNRSAPVDGLTRAVGCDSDVVSFRPFLWTGKERGDEKIAVSFHREFSCPLLFKRKWEKAPQTFHGTQVVRRTGRRRFRRAEALRVGGRHVLSHPHTSYKAKPSSRRTLGRGFCLCCDILQKGLDIDNFSLIIRAPNPFLHTPENYRFLVWKL